MQSPKPLKYVHAVPFLLSLMMVPSFARGIPAPRPPEVGAESSEWESTTPTTAPKDESTSNVGAVNEGGGSANTNGMNNGLSPNSSGSGTLSSRASDQTGITFGRSPTPPNSGKGAGGSVEPKD